MKRFNNTSRHTIQAGKQKQISYLLMFFFAKRI
jgi:hypothetical protein